MKRPSPVPGFDAPGTSTRPNFSKMRACWSLGIPGPSSRTVIRTAPFAAAADTRTRPPSRVCQRGPLGRFGEEQLKVDFLEAVAERSRLDARGVENIPDQCGEP